MGIEDFIRDALYQPNDYVGYHVGRELAELHPDKTIVEGRNWEFQIEAFARAGRCSVVKEKSVFHHTTRNWEGIGTPPTAKSLRTSFSTQFVNGRVKCAAKLLCFKMVGFRKTPHYSTRSRARRSIT